MEALLNSNSNGDLIDFNRWFKMLDTGKYEPEIKENKEHDKMIQRMEEDYARRMNEHQNVFHERYLCRRCHQKMRLNLREDLRVCMDCGCCEKASIEYYSYNRMSSLRPFIESKDKYRTKRLRATIRKMKLDDDDDVVRQVTARFKTIGEYYDNCFSDRKCNIMRYTYLLSKILQVMGRNDLFDEKWMPKKKTLVKYEVRWEKICEFANWPCSKSAL